MAAPHLSLLAPHHMVLLHFFLSTCVEGDVPFLALFFVVLAAGLGNDVRSTYQDIRQEHKVKLRNIKAAVDAL